jgi:transposase InsO family protein
LDYITLTSQRSGQKINWILSHLGLSTNTYYRWRNMEAAGNLEDQYRPVPNLDAILAREIEATIKFALENPKEGYRRLSYMMIDEDIACLTPSSVYRILSDRDLLCRYKKYEKSTGRYDFKPTRPHQQWHIDIMYLWVSHRWYFFVGVLDAYSRYIVHWDLLETASSSEIRAVTESALKKYPGEKPRIVTDNGIQFKSKDFRQLIKDFSLIDIKIRIRHPESNGKIERFHRSLREEGLTEKQLENKYKALEIIDNWVTYYNHQRLHAALKYLRPVDYLNGQESEKLAARREKLNAAAKIRREENRNLHNQIVKEQKAVA